MTRDQATAECVNRWGLYSQALEGKDGKCYVARAFWVFYDHVQPVPKEYDGRRRGLWKLEVLGSGLDHEAAFEDAGRQLAKAAGLFVMERTGVITQPI